MNSTITLEQFEMLLPLACEWAAAQEQRILATGEALSDTMLGDARLVGVAAPKRIRLLYVPEIPIPDDPALRAAVEETQFLSPLTRGLALRYGIFIRSDSRFDRTMVIHELGTPRNMNASAGSSLSSAGICLSVSPSATLKHRWSKR